MTTKEILKSEDCYLLIERLQNKVVRLENLLKFQKEVNNMVIKENLEHLTFEISKLDPEVKEYYRNQSYDEIYPPGGHEEFLRNEFSKLKWRP